MLYLTLDMNIEKCLQGRNEGLQEKDNILTINLS